MLPSKRRSVRLEVESERGTEIFLIDGQHRLLEKASNRASFFVDPGLYKLKFKSGNSISEEIVVIEAGEKERVVRGRPLPFTSSIPIAGASNWTSFHGDAAQELFKRSAAAKLIDSEAVFFFADCEFSRRTHPAHGTTLHAADGKQIVDFLAACDYDLQKRWASFRAPLPPSNYRLRSRLPGQGAREFCFSTLRGLRTSVFLSMVGDGNRHRTPTTSLATLRIGMGRPDSLFDPASPYLTWKERIFAALSNRRAVTSSDEVSLLFKDPDSDPIMLLMAAINHSWAKGRDTHLLKGVLHDLRKRFGHLPDLAALSIELGYGQEERVEMPPMLRANWPVLVRETARTEGLIPVDSLCDLISDRIDGDGPWLTWRVPEIKSRSREGRLEFGDFNAILEEVERVESREDVAKRARSLRLNGLQRSLFKYAVNVVLEGKTRGQSQPAMAGGGGHALPENPLVAAFKDSAIETFGLPSATIRGELYGMSQKIQATAGHRLMLRVPEHAPEPNDFYVNLKSGRFHATSRQDLESLFQAIATGPGQSNLVVHFHGGLVNTSDGMGIAQRLSPLYREAGAHPVFFVWESGLFESISNNLGEIAKEKIFQRLLSRVLQFVIGRIKAQFGVRGIGVPMASMEQVERVRERALSGERDEVSQKEREGLALNPEETMQLQAEFENDPILRGEVLSISAGLAPNEGGERSMGVVAGKATRMSPEVLAELKAPHAGGARALFFSPWMARHGVAIVGRALLRFVRGRDHGIYATAVEEILRELYVADAGRIVWETMKKDTADAFDGAPDCGGTAFLELLAARLKDNPARITLVGHSTGAVYICHLLKKAKSLLPAQTKLDVVFLAPACDFGLLAKTLEECRTQIGEFRIFGMSDELERSDCLVPLVYPHSLLYFVSGLLEDEADKPIVGMQRFFDASWANAAADHPDVRAVREFTAKNAIVVWSKADNGLGQRSQAEKHGDFDDDPPTLQSLKEFISRA